MTHRTYCFVLTLILAANTIWGQTSQPNKPPRRANAPAPASAPKRLTYELSGNFIYQTQDDVTISQFGQGLSLNDGAYVVLTLLTVRDVDRGPMDQVNSSIVLVPGETKKMTLWNVIKPQALAKGCEALINLDTAGNLTISPLPGVGNPPIPKSCAFSARLAFTFRALVIRPE